MPPTIAAPPDRRSLDTALAGLAALASALERGAAARPVAGGRSVPPSPVVGVPGRSSRRSCWASVARAARRLVLHGVGALLLVSGVLGVVGWAVMAVLPQPPRPALASVPDTTPPIHPLVVLPP